MPHRFIHPFWASPLNPKCESSIVFDISTQRSKLLMPTLSKVPGKQLVGQLLTNFPVCVKETELSWGNFILPVAQRKKKKKHTKNSWQLIFFFSNILNLVFHNVSSTFKIYPGSNIVRIQPLPTTVPHWIKLASFLVWIIIKSLLHFQGWNWRNPAK